MSKHTRDGFTILELLIIVGIIAVIAGVVFFFVGRARAKGYDAKVQQVMSTTIRTSATDEFSDQGSFANVCTSGKTYDAITALAQGINLVGSYGCAADTSKYAVVFPLKAQSGYWCVDSLGASGIVADNNAVIAAKNCTGVSTADLGGGGGGGIPENIPPPSSQLSASAGGDQTLTLPISSTTLLGVASGGSGTYTYGWSKVSGGSATIAMPTSVSTSITGLAAGNYTFRLSVNDGTSTVTDDVAITVKDAVPAGLTPYGGTPWPVPGTIQVENFDNGGEGVAYHDTTNYNAGGKYRPSEFVDIENTQDTGGGYNIGWTANTEWLRYTINAEAGTYTLKARVASAGGAGSINVEVDGGQVGTIIIPTTGGNQTWQTVTVSNIPLTQGSHVIKLVSTGGNYNINYITFEKNAVPVGDVPAARTLDVRGPISIPQMGPYATISFYESLPRGYYNDASKKWPLLVMMHGAGENPPQTISSLTRNGPIYWISQGEQLEFNINGKTETFVVIAPQTDWWHPYTIDRIIEYAKSNYNIDQTRIYLTGLSAGSFASVAYPAFAVDHGGNAYAQKLAAIAAVDGFYGNVTWPTTITTPNDANGADLNYCYINTANVATWLFGSSGHNGTMMSMMRDTLNACNPPPSKAVKYTFYNGDSNAWTKAYDPSHTYENPNIYEWLLSQHR